MEFRGTTDQNEPKLTIIPASDHNEEGYVSRRYSRTEPHLIRSRSRVGEVTKTLLLIYDAPRFAISAARDGPNGRLDRQKGPERRTGALSKLG